MSSSDAGAQEPEGLADIFAAIRDLARQLFSDPAKIDKIIQTLKIWGLWPAIGLPQAGPDDYKLSAIMAEVAAEKGMPQADGPEAGGRLLEVLRAAMQWAKEHPEILAALLAFLKL